MLKTQKHLFDLPDNVAYLNGAYMSPLMKEVKEAGIRGIQSKSLPYQIKVDDFFNPVDQLKKSFCKLINGGNAQRVAIVPSASYAISTAAQNISIQKGEEIIVLADQFPSNYYPWERLAKENDAVITTISPISNSTNKVEEWNQKIITQISDQTAVVAMAHIHWADGSLFDLEAISKKAKAHNALLIIDGTQSIGALPFDQSKIQADVIVCASYKWMFGPYGIGCAYFGSHFDNGKPIEESWLNRLNSEDFTGLVNYQSQYKPKAARYSVGENPNFILVPMAQKALDQVLVWGVENLQQYSIQTSKKGVENLKELGCLIEPETSRSGHLFGVRIGGNFDLNSLKTQFSEQQVFVSFRGDSIRISTSIYNSEIDFQKLVHCFQNSNK